MAELKNITDLLVHSIKDLYSAETQLVKALPKMAKAANDPALREAFETHLEETKIHVERLEEIASILEITPRGVSCKAMKGLVEEGEEEIGAKGEPSVKDLALIAAAQKVEHYEISGYGSARALAEALGHDEIVGILQATLDEEGKADHLLTDLAEGVMESLDESAAV
ncbi:MAG: ferritin-like domain-containing protein [Luteolibacter sp.]